MEQVTLLLLKLLGPYYIIAGLGILVNRERVMKMAKNLKTSSIGYYLAVSVNVLAGLAIIQYHNIWNSLPEILVSLIGWLSLIKGTVGMLAPKPFKKLASGIVKSGFITAGGIVAIVLGIYLSASGF